MNIDINLVKNEGDLYDLIRRDDKILELYHDDTRRLGELKFFVYEPKQNRLSEISPEDPKTDLVYIHVCYKAHNDVYYAMIDEIDSESLDVNIMSFNIASKETSLVCSLRETKEVLTGEKRIRVFILSPTLFLVQTEIVDLNASKSLMGTILFSQALYDRTTHQPVEIIEENLKNNGINMISVLNDSEVMIKTGFSALEDSRLSFGSSKEALIESIYVTSLAKFTDDIFLMKKNFDMQLLISTYVDRYILRPEVKDDYIFYNVVDVENLESDCVFYNFRTGEKITGKNTEIDIEDMRLAYVVANTPYVRKYVENSCEFVNMLTLENDISFYDEDFVDICGDLFITTRRHGKREHLRVYKYPHMDVVLDERCHYISGRRIDNDYYLYIVK